MGSTEAPPTARIAALAPSLHPGERKVVEALAADPEAAVERSAQEVAEHVGVGRATVIRAVQSLGYDGYPQLRVALTRELATARPELHADGSLLGTMRESAGRFGARLEHTLSALTEDDLDAVVTALDEADELLIAANGLSAPLGLDLVLRLTAAGRPALYLPDMLGQEIAARQLKPGSVCLAVSGSGASRATISVMSAARESGATVLALTSFARSAVTELADTTLVLPPVNDSFRDELIHTSRAALMLVIESLVDLLVARRGERSQGARSATLAVVSRALEE